MMSPTDHGETPMMSPADHGETGITESPAGGLMEETDTESLADRYT
jgi:hypothetical protein